MRRVGEVRQEATAAGTNPYRRWRLIDDGKHSARWNMAMDEAIMDAVADGLAPPTLRFYDWDSSAVTVGRFQNVDRDVNMAFCRSMNLPVVRRPTGGRGILHGGDLTFSIVVPLAALGEDQGVTASYRRLASGILTGLAQLGVQATMGECERREGRGGDCFASRSRADVLDGDGSKLIGSAQRRSGEMLLQQSSLRHTPPHVDPSNVFQGIHAEEEYPLAMKLRSILIACLIKGLESASDMTLNRGSITGWEEERTAFLLASYKEL